MHSFKTEQGVEYHLEFNIGKARKFKDRLDLLDGEMGKIFEELHSKPLTRLDLMLAMATDAEGKPVDQAEFEDSLNGPTLKRANDAFWEEVKVFIQSVRPEAEEVMGAMMERMKSVQAKQTAMMIEWMESDETMETIDQTMKEIRDKATSQLRNSSITSAEQSD